MLQNRVQYHSGLDVQRAASAKNRAHKEWHVRPGDLQKREVRPIIRCHSASAHQRGFACPGLPPFPEIVDQLHKGFRRQIPQTLSVCMGNTLIKKRYNPR